MVKKSLSGAILAIALVGSANASWTSFSQDFNTCASVAACGAAITFVADGSAASVNLRGADDIINTSGNTGFDNFFSSRFLVIGENAGPIGSEPNGQPSGGLSRASFSLGTLSAGSYVFNVVFDYVVDSNSATNPDDFLVSFETGTGTGLLATVLNTGDIVRNNVPRETAFNTTISFVLGSASNVNLSFALAEFNGDRSSAAGIDNLRIQQVPEPASLALVGLGLAGLAALGRRR